MQHEPVCTLEISQTTYLYVFLVIVCNVAVDDRRLDTINLAVFQLHPHASFVIMRRNRDGYRTHLISPHRIVAVDCRSVLFSPVVGPKRGSETVCQVSNIAPIIFRHSERASMGVGLNGNWEDGVQVQRCELKQ